MRVPMEKKVRFRIMSPISSWIAKYITQGDIEIQLKGETKRRAETHRLPSVFAFSPSPMCSERVYLLWSFGPYLASGLFKPGKTYTPTEFASILNNIEWSASIAPFKGGIDPSDAECNNIIEETFKLRITIEKIETDNWDRVNFSKVIKRL